MERIIREKRILQPEKRILETDSSFNFSRCSDTFLRMQIRKGRIKESDLPADSHAREVARDERNRMRKRALVLLELENLLRR